MGLLAADALAPFLPTILLSQVWRNLKRSHFDISAGLALHPWHWWLISRIMVYAALTMLLALWTTQNPKPKQWLKAFGLAATFALALELMKPMIVSRTLNVANIATALIGIIIAVTIDCYLRNRKKPFNRLCR